MTHRLALLITGLLTCGMIAAACSSSPGSPHPGVASISSSPTATASSSGSQKTSVLAYSRCMRAHGVSDFPDPDANGNLRIAAHPGSDLSPNNPTYKAADTACKSLMPPPKALPSNMRAADLKYARCMRQHGISDFPDPNPDGGIQIQSTPGSDLDPDNPMYKAADNACKKYLPGGGAGGTLDSTGGAGSGGS